MVFEMYGVLNKTKETINIIRAWLKTIHNPNNQFLLKGSY